VTGRAAGRVVAVSSHAIEAELPFARVGCGVRIRARDGALAARVAALRGARAVVTPFGAVDGIALGDRVEADPRVLRFPPPTALLGRAVDFAGAPLDGDAPVRARAVAGEVHAPAPRDRRPCATPFWTGVRAIDGPLTLARGARIGLFGGPGCGKSTLLDAIVRGACADAVVVALIGERGREAERRLASLDARTTLICATSDRAPAERVRAAEVAFEHAAALRARALDVLLVVDSLARIAGAARELALGCGEAAGRGGYPPSVFGTLARLLERAGPAGEGSVTLIATVLSDGPDERDPVSEAARAALDGHLVLRADLARAGRFPAVDVVGSTRRTLADAASPEHVRAARLVRSAVAALEGARDARSLGLDPSAGDPFLVRCIEVESEIERFLRQGEAPSTAESTLTELVRLADRIDDGRLL
jgi:FliI/YscN family ATPase